MIFMPWHPPYLSRHIEALGYEKAKDLISYRYRHRRGAARRERRASPAARNGATASSCGRSTLRQLKTGETALMEELFNDGWSDNWGFVPFTKAEFDSTADALKLVMPPEFGIVVELDGAPSSFVIALPNLFEIVSDFDGRLFPFGLPKLISRMRNHKFEAARIVLLGTRKALQNSATGGAILLAHDRGNAPPRRRRLRSSISKRAGFSKTISPCASRSKCSAARSIRCIGSTRSVYQSTGS